MQKFLMLLAPLAVPDTIIQRNGYLFFRSSVLHNDEGELVTNALIKCPAKAVNEVIEKYGQGHEAIPHVLKFLTMVFPKQNS